MRDGTTTIIINEYGTSLRKRGKRFIICNPDRPEIEIAACKVNRIILPTKGASVTCDALTLAMDYMIPVHVNSYSDQTTAYLANPLDHGMVSLRKAQYVESNTELGFFLASMFIVGKIKNQRGHLLRRARNIKKRNPKLGNHIGDTCKQIQKIILEIDSLGHDPNGKEALFGLEGNAASLYWSAIAKLTSREEEFTHRITRNAGDYVNRLLNYGYAILRSEVLSAIVGCGLDPFAGFLHSDRSGKPSLVLDIMEEFRAYVVDAQVCKLLLLTGGSNIEGGNDLGAPVRRELAQSILARLEKRLYDNSAMITVKAVIRKQVETVVSTLRTGRAFYIPFVFKW
ncbi:MAG: CRISPR-associated endonuclease Cas1 [Candidatus Thorarchaeota archaeon]|nr:CRISPR-associated endonuclease Cas1 [Candidatus Thorarchaeota archaeon]